LKPVKECAKTFLDAEHRRKEVRELVSFWRQRGTRSSKRALRYRKSRKLDANNLIECDSRY